MNILQILQEESAVASSLQMLYEFLGNLDVVDKQLLKVLKTVPAYNTKPRLNDKVGQNSTVDREAVVGKNGDKTWNKFKDDATCLTMVLVYDGKQVLAVSDLVRLGQSSGKVCYVAFSPKMYSDVIPAEEILKLTKLSPASITRAVELTISATRKLLDIVVAKARAEGKTIEAMYIRADDERQATNKARKTARAGMVPLPGTKDTVVTSRKWGRTESAYKVYIDGLRYALKSRLEAYKGSKAKTFATPEEMLESLIKEGYLEKLNFKGETYNLENERIYLKDLMKASKGGNTDSISKSYLEYRLADEYNDKRMAVRSKIHAEFKAKEEALKAKFNNELNDESKAAFVKLDAEERAARREALAPSYLYVILGLEGGKIVPVSIDTKSPW
jgi:hypothetical protein